MRLALTISRMDHRGGAERLTGDLAAALATRGHDVVLLTGRRGDDVWPEFADAFPVREIPVSRMAAAARAAGPDHVLAMDHETWRELAGGRRDGDPPLAVYFHGLLRRLEWRAAERRLLARLDVDAEAVPSALREVIDSRRRAERNPLRRLRHASERRRDGRALAATDRVLANSRTTREGLFLAWGINATVCEPGIRFPADDPAPLPPRDGLLVATALRRKKNVGTILEALALLGREEAPAPRLTVLGAGPEEARLRTAATRLGIEDRVEWPGVAADDELDRRLRGARALVHVPTDEPFGLIVVEALVRGTPVVVSDHGGPAEIARRAGAAAAAPVDPFDAKAVAAGIRRARAAPLPDPAALRDRLADLRIDRMAERIEEALAPR